METESGMVVAGGCLAGGGGAGALWGEFQFGKKKFWRWMVVTFAQQRESP